jgi:ABC-2 type transport system permease protein
MNWNRILTIARWEYMQKIRSKAFILSLVLTPALIIGFGVLPTILAGSEPDETKVIGIVDQTGELASHLKQRIESSDKLASGESAWLISNYPVAGGPIDSAIARADRDALAERIEGVAIIRDSAGTTTMQYRSPNPSNFRVIELVDKNVERIVTERRLAEAGVDTSIFTRVTQPVKSSTVKISDAGKDQSVDFGETFFAAYIGIILLMVLILTTGQSLMRSLVEEKSNRIMEILVSSSVPQELMWGKLLGLSALGVTQAASWLVIGLVVVSARSIEINLDILAFLPYVLIYMLLGYLFYASIFIGVGSLVTTEQEAQVMTSYLTMLLVMPIAFAIAVMQNPNATYVKVLSYIPLLTPTMMMLRVVTKMPPLWEIAVTIGLMVISTAAVAWLAGKIFRTAILLYGKRPTIAEVLRWLRA